MKWVKCSDALPIMDTQVIVFVLNKNGKHGMMDMVYFHGKDSYDPWFYGDGSYALEDVTHWMPLPPEPAA